MKIYHFPHFSVVLHLWIAPQGGKCPNVIIFACHDLLTKNCCQLLYFHFTASTKTGAWTHTTKRRYGTLLPSHAEYDKTTKAYFLNQRTPKTKVDQLTGGNLFPSFTFITGQDLTRKIRTQFGNVKAVLDDEDDATADGTDVILGTASNRIDRLYPAFVSDAEAGKVHAVLLHGPSFPADRRDFFPHGPDFDAADAPLLAPFFVPGKETDKHFVALPPIVHPNNWGSDDVANGKADAQTIQSFGDAAGPRGAAWLEAELRWSFESMEAILTNKDTYATLLPKMTLNRMHNGRLLQTMVTPDTEDRLALGSSALDERIEQLVTKAGADELPLDIEFKEAAGGTPNAVDKRTDAETAEKKRRAQRSAGAHLMFAHVADDDSVSPPNLSAGGQILFDIRERLEANRAYNEAAIAAVDRVCSPEHTHYLGRAASIQEGGMTDYMSACFMQVLYRNSPLTSIGEAVTVKNGASVAFLIPRHDTKQDAKGTNDNTKRQLEFIMGESTDHLTKLTQHCEVNEEFGSFEDCLGLVANVWLQQQLFFEAEPKSSLTLFAETIGDSLSVPSIRRWLKRVGPKKPEIAFAILNYVEQAYILASGQTRKRTETAKVIAGNWDGVDNSPYLEIHELGVTLTNKLDSASRGGETFAPCRLYENSEAAKALQRAADALAAQQIISLKRNLQRNDGSGGGDQKKARRELEAKATSLLKQSKKNVPTEADKKGDILYDRYMQCPTIPGSRQPCGAFYRQGVTCAKFLDTGKCFKDHTPINNLPAEGKKAWCAHVNETEGMDFNTATVTCMKKEGGKWIVQ